MFEEREPWRHDAEVACLKSGAVRESSNLVRIAPIEGPGICGADFPLKVAALGESTTALGFAEPPRPPGTIPTVAQPPWPVAQPRIYTPQPVYAPPPVSPAVTPQRQPPYMPQAQLGDPGPPLQLAPPIDQTERPPSPSASPPLPPLGPRAPQYTGAIGPVEVKPAATLACPIVSVLDQWITQSVQPAAQRWFGQPVVEIKQISAYSCRSMNNQRGAKISEHAFGNALDVAAFVLADGRVVKVKEGWRGAPEEQGFLRDVQGAACDQFSTVLAPGADAFHYDHIHVDLMRRTSGRKICQPAAVDGELVAYRAQNRNPQSIPPSMRLPPLAPLKPNTPFDPRNDPYAWRGAAVKTNDPVVTGSVAAKSQTPTAIDHDWIEDDGPRLPLK